MKISNMITIFFCLLALALAFLRWDESREYASESNRLKRKIARKERQSDSIEVVVSGLVARIDSGNAQISALKALLKNKDVEISHVKQKLSDVAQVDFNSLPDTTIVNILSKVNIKTGN